jgi:hypothetical protein
MYLGYKDEKIKFYTEQPLDTTLYGIDRIEETDEEYVLDGEQYILKDEAWEEKQAQKEAERIAHLSLTRGDVLRGLLLAKGVTKEQISQMIEAMPTSSQEQIVVKELAKIDFEDALNFYRGVPLIDTIGLQLGFTKEQLDEFFETNDYRYLTNCTITINPTPAEAVVTINGVKQMSITVPYGSEVYYIVTAEGYKEQSGTVIVVESETFGVVLEEVENENTADTAE